MDRQVLNVSALLAPYFPSFRPSRDKKVCRGLLVSLGAHVVVGENAFEGQEAVRTYRPNLVLSDILLPGRDGFALLRDIRAPGPDAGGNVPVIAMTALVRHVDRTRVLNACFQAYLPKPFTPDRLLE